MKWYEALGITVLSVIMLLSIIDIRTSIDHLTDEIRKWREESKG